MKIAIMQPTYLPWCGYFNLIKSVDVFVFLDDVAFSKQSWQQRNKIMSSNGALNLTVPVITKNRLGQRICDVEIQDDRWIKKHTKSISQCYSKHPFGLEMSAFIDDCLSLKTSSLGTINSHIIMSIAKMLNLKTEFCFSSDLDVGGRKSQHVINICEILNGNTYLSPVGAKDYIAEEGLFDQSSIELVYQDYNPVVYEQYKSSEFIPYLSIIDLIANVGFGNTLSYI